MTDLASNAWRVLKTNWGTLKDLLDVDFVSNWVIKDEFREFLSRRFDLHFQTSSEFSKTWFNRRSKVADQRVPGRDKSQNDPPHFRHHAVASSKDRPF